MSCTINASTTAGLVSTADLSGSLQLQTNSGTTAVTIDTSQNVGIGTTSPASKLHVESSSVADLAEILKSTDATNGRSVIYIASVKNSAGTQSNVSMEAQSVSGANADLVFRTNGSNVTVGSEKMRIDSSGRVSINGSSLDSTWLTINGNVSNPTLESYQNTTSLCSHFWFRNPNGVVGSITLNGSSTAYNTSSDYRLKENIAPMTGALAKVAQLKPVTFKWKVDGSDCEGFLAHELQEVKPDCVSGEKDAVDADGKPVYQGIDTSFLVATLTAAIQEAKALIDTQAETINALTARIVALEGV